MMPSNRWILSKAVIDLIFIIKILVSNCVENEGEEASIGDE